MITIDQRLIDAPAGLYPRSAGWWRGFVPPWASVTVHDDGTVTLEPSGLHMRYTTGRGVWWERDDSPKSYRATERSLTRWVVDNPRLAVAVIESKEHQDITGTPERASTL